MTYSDHGGMAPAWLTIEVKDKKLFVKEKKMADVNETLSFCDLSEKEIASLYGVFVENKFDLIENQQPDEVVYDAGSSGLRIAAGEISHSVSSGANAPLASSDQVRFGKIRGAFLTLLKAKRPLLKPQFPVAN